MRAVKEFANAKINLYLDVMAKRDDGFHDIRTVMHSISLCDEITVSVEAASKTDVKLFLVGNKFLPTDSKNLAVRAAMLYLSKAGINASVAIQLKKKIPVSAGLAGGSSDAAAVLRAMNRLFDKLFSERALLSMAAELGSDVPFCLYGKTALCEGRGEILTKLPDSLKLNLVVATAGEHVSTPQAYGELDKIYSDFDGSIEINSSESFHKLLDALNGDQLTQKALFNIFEDAVLPACPGAKSLKEKLSSLGAYATLMSGSGPSVYGLFADEASACEASRQLKNEGFKSFVAKSI